MAATKKAPKGKTKTAPKSKKTATPKKRAVSLAKKSKKTVAPKKTTKKVKSKTVQKKSTPAKKLKPIKKETLIKSGGPLTFPQSVSLSVFVPALVPAQPEQLAVGIARFSGIFFVLIGAFFASYHSIAQFFPNTFATVTGTASVATVIDSCATDPSTSTADACASLETSAAVQEPEPVVLFSIKATPPLVGTVPVSINVARAEQVKVKLYAKSTGDYFELGLADYLDGDDWIIDWNTKEYRDDEYIIYALVTNEIGTYDAKSSAYEVSNMESSHASTSANSGSSTNDDADNSTNDITATSTDLIDKTVTDTSAESSSESEILKITSIAVSDRNPISDKFTFTILSQFAEEVKVISKHIDTAKQHFFGAAVEKKEGEWVLEVDSTEYLDGDYSVSVKASNSESDAVSSGIQLTFANSSSVDTDSTEANEIVTPEALSPDVDIELSTVDGTKLIGDVKFTVQVPGVEFMEVYLIPQYSLTHKFVGLAHKISADLWVHKFDSTSLPNGKYRMFVRIKNSYGLFDSDAVTIEIANEIFTSEPAAAQRSVNLDDDTSSTSEIEEARESYTIASTTNTSTNDYEIVSSVSLLESEQQEILYSLLDQLSAAIRVNDEDAIKDVKNRIFKLRSELEDANLSFDQKNNLIAALDEELRELIVKIEEGVTKTNHLIEERTGESSSKDSDADGVADYDEINIYNTDPLDADTDKDGFIDGAEILNGYNPTDPTPEVLVAFESPKVTGVVRNDLLMVESIITLTEPEGDRDGVNGMALITGKAFPNSFVTIYIFSTPIIVTVKTDADGSWEYRFDKELEDGSHEIYVGVTDNAGKLVAKSEPLLFIKEAQAFTPVDAEEAAVSAVSQIRDDDSLASNHMIMIIGSISVVTIGLVLILIGAFLAKREEEIVAVPQTSSLAV